jgi:RNA polymerase sigma-70 factor (ECF subfamily)
MNLKTIPSETPAGPDAAMARYAAGDDTAFAEVYAAIAPRLTRFLNHRLRRRTALPDLVQETLLRVHRARRTFVAGAPVIPWVLAIARRQLIDTHRRGAREEPEEYLDDRPGAHAPGYPGPLHARPASGEEMALAREVAARVEGALSRIPEPQRAALRLREGDGLSVAEAAAELGTTPNGIKLRTHRAVRALRAELAAA